MNKELYEEYNEVHNKVFHYMALLGYKEIEINEAIEFYNLHHVVSLYCFELPIIIGRLVKIIEKGLCYYETY